MLSNLKVLFDKNNNMAKNRIRIQPLWDIETKQNNLYFDRIILVQKKIYLFLAPTDT